ncbi:MAG: hypothetical protein L0G87_04560 [Renibacterium salmoninarum]|nr:hypothetical protein [Renibacterium salmoninarum]
MKFTQETAQHLTKIIQAQRPTWTTNGIMNALSKLAIQRTPGQALDQALNAAKDPTAKTPTAITFDQYQHQQAASNTTNAPPCEDHEGETAHNCRACKADIKLGQRPPHLIGKHHQPGDTP